MTCVDEIADVVKPGEVLDGKYLVEAQLGAGGMGIVVAARHVSSRQEVAIKMLFPSALANPEAVARFSREAKAAARIRSEHAVKMFDVGRMPSGAPYLVMERLQGADLQAVLTERGTLPVEVAADYVLQACEALAEAHALGIVHRDLKSANLFLTRRADGSPCVKVLDFGISKMVELEGEGGGTVLTATQSMLGSPAYMSPEQLVSAKRVDARSDVWGLGVILYELVSGTLPFDGASMMQLFTNIARGTPAPLPPSVPRDLAAIIFKCLEKLPANRLQDVAAFTDAIAPFASPDMRTTAARRVRMNAAAAAARAMPVDDEARTLLIEGPGSAAARRDDPRPPLIDEPSNPAAARTLDESRSGARPASRVSLLAAGMAMSLALFGAVGLLIVRLQAPPPTPSAGPASTVAATTEPIATAAVLPAIAAPSARPSAEPATPAETATAEATSTPAPAASSRPRAPVPGKPRPRGGDPFDTRN